MKKHFGIILATIIIILAMTGCAHRFDEPQGMPRSGKANASVEEALDIAAGLRQQSVRDKDLQSFLSLIDTDYHPTYYNEQTHWFEDAFRQGIKGFACSVDSVEHIEGDYWQVRLDESYEYDGEEYTCNYPTIFRIEESEGRYTAYLCGYDFQTMENDYAVFYYQQQNEELVAELCEQSVAEIERVYDTFGYTPEDKLIINMYPGQKHMIWSVKPSLPDWVGGWAEPGESVKMCYFSTYTADEYMTTMAHEACHMVVSALSDNNACYWLQEGLAGLLEQDGMGMNTYDKAMLMFNKGSGTLFSFEQLQYEDYEAMDDQFAVSGYYASCKAAAYILYKEYGLDGVIGLLESLKGQGGKVGYSRERLIQMSEKNMLAIEDALGMNEEEFSQKYDRLMEKLTGE